MTKSLEQMSLEYDRLYREAQAILDKYNPCNVKIENGKAVCNSTRAGESESPCCGGCQHLTEGIGCTVSALTCKLWLCSWARITYPECDIALTALSMAARSNGFSYLARASKQQYFSYLFSEYKPFEESFSV